MTNADGQVWIKTLIDNSDAKKSLDQMEDEMQKFQKEISKNESAKLPFEKQMTEYGVSLDAAKQKLHELAEEQQRIAGIIGGTVDATPEQAIAAFNRQKDNAAEIKLQQAEVEKLQQKWNTAADKVDEYNAKIAVAKDQLAYGEEIAGQLTANMTGAGESTNRMAAATEKAQKKMQKLNKRIGSILKSALVFSVLYAGLNKLKNLISSYIKKDKELTAALAGLKAAWLTAFQPVWEVIQPALLALMRIMTAVAKVIATVFSLFTGKSTKDMADNAKALNTEQEALEGVGGAAEEASKSLAGFDEINQLDAGKTTGGGGGGAGSTGGTDLQLDFDAMDQIGEEFGALEVYISGFLLALGAILAFSGANIPLGLGLLAAGAIGIASAASGSWNNMPQKVKKTITTVMTIVSGALLALGAILAFSGANIPLGIGLLAAGALGLAATAYLNWDTIKQKLQGPMGEVVAAVSVGLLAVGAILAFSGVALPLGIALLAAGAIGLATTAYLNWNTLKENINPSVEDIFKYVSAAVLVLGIILACTGVALPLGIALIALGAAGLVSTTALDWGAILRNLKGVWESIKTWWNTSVEKYFTLEYWQEKLSPITNAIQSILDKLQQIRENRINGITMVSDYYQEQAGMQSYATVRSVPALASGAVIPPNQKFLALLGDQKSGTNIETPLSTMVQAFRQAMNEGGYGGKRTVILQVDKREFGRVTFDAYNEESQRVGVSIGGEE